MSTASVSAGAPRAPQPMTARHWLVAAGGFLVMIAASVVLSGLSLLHPFIVRDMFTDDHGQPMNGSQPAFLTYFTVLTIMIVVTMMFVAGKLIAKFGPRFMLGVGFSIMGLGVLLFAFAPNPVMFYVAGGVIGVGYGLSQAPIPPVITTSWFEAKRGLVLGIVLSGSGVGGLLWSVVTPRMAQSMGWRPTIVGMAVVLVVVSLVATVFLIRNTPADTGLRRYGAVPGEDGAPRLEDPETLPGFTSRDAMRNPWFWLLSLSFVMIGMIVSVTQVLPILLNVYTGVNISVFSLLLATWTFTLIFWKPLLGIINDKIGVIWMMTITLGLMALGFLYLPQMSSPAAGFGGAALVLPMLAMVFMSAGVSNATVAPPLVLRHTVGARDYSKLLSLGLSFYYIGSALGAPLWGAIQTLTGTYNSGLYAAPVVLALIVIFSLLAGRNASTSWTNKAPAKDVSPAD